MDLMRVLKNVITNPPYPSSWATLYLAQNRCVRILTYHFRGVVYSGHPYTGQREAGCICTLVYCRTGLDTVGLAWTL